VPRTDKLQQRLQQALDEKKQQHRYRRRRINEGAQQVESIIDRQNVISFCSNDYLGFANHPKIRETAINAIRHYGVGSGAAHLINGHSRAHHQLEEALAEFTGYPRALLFSTGYMANLGTCQALLGSGDVIFEDKLNHASLIDAGLNSGARFQRYLHSDLNQLELRLNKMDTDKSSSDGLNLVVSDAVFSMDGDIADIPGLVKLCQPEGRYLMLDDAHGFGVLGDTGRGTLEHFGVPAGNVDIYMATLGKAVGTAGAFVAGSEALVESLIQQARTYIYTTAMPAAIAEATRTSLKLIDEEPEHLITLQRNIHYFRQSCAQNDIRIEASQSAIQPVIIGEESATVALSEQLFEHGLLVTAIRPPTVPNGTSRLRITLSAAHELQHIDQLIDQLGVLLTPNRAGN
jgi:8-amino-7-oxononanoate synthase